MGMTHKERRAEQRRVLFDRFLKGARHGEFDSVRGPDGKVRAGVWDRVCVPGHDEKDGQSTDFTLETLSQMVDNFVDRGDPIPLDYNHQSNYSHINGQPAPALAWYGALAVVMDGEVVKMGCAAGVSATGAEPGMDLSKDGLWAFRHEVTEIGQELLPGFKLTSPTFTSEGTKRDGTPVGYCLAAVAATNTPWQGGTSITFARTVEMRVEQRGDSWVVLPESGDKVLGTHKTKADADKQLAAIEASKHKQEVTMAAGLATCKVCKQRESVNPSTGNFIGHLGKDGNNCPGSGKPAGAVGYDNGTTNEGAATMAKAKFAKFAGAADGADDAAIKSALSAKTAELAKAAMADEAFKYDEAAKELEDMAAEMDGEEGFEGEAAEMSKMAQKFRRFAKFDADGDKDDDEKAKMAKLADDEEKAKMADEKDKADGEAKMAVMSATLRAQGAELARLKAAEQAREAAAAAEREQRFEAFADRAIAAGYPKEDRAALLKFARTDFAGAQKVVASLLPSTGAPAHLFSRLSGQGAPLGQEKGAREFAGPAKPREVKTPFGRFVETDGAYADAVKKLAESKDPNLMAKVDKYITGGAPAQAQMFNRLLAAEKIVRAEQPELAESAE